jgi:ribosomal-protein-alanine N-acetyltransferase
LPVSADAFPYTYTFQDAERFLKACAAGDETRQLYRAIAVAGEAVGSIGISLGADVYRRSAELGYWLAEDFWGKGIMTAAVKRLWRKPLRAFDMSGISPNPTSHTRLQKSAGKAAYAEGS